MRTVVVLSILVGVTSCTDSVVHEMPSAETAPSDFIARPLGRMSFAGAESFRGDTDAARDARLSLLDDVMERFRRIRSALRSEHMGRARYDAVWAELDAANVSDAEQWFVEQMAATLILESMVGTTAFRAGDLATGEWDHEVGSRSTELLLKHENPNAPLIATALERLKGHWTDERISTSASTAMSYALRWIEDDCEECSRKSVGSRPDDLPGGIDVQKYREGINHLMRLAQGR